MIKLFIVVLTLSLFGCSSENQSCKKDLDKCQLVDSRNIDTFNNQCRKLGECMGLEWTVVHFSTQSNNPYACAIKKPTKVFGISEAYLYPKGEISFEKIESSNLENEIKICEMLKDSGEWSEKQQLERKKMYEALDAERKERKERESKPFVRPPLKIREER